MKAAAGTSTSSSRTMTNFDTGRTTPLRETTLSSAQFIAGRKSSALQTFREEASASRTVGENRPMTSPVQGAELSEVLASENSSQLSTNKENPSSLLSTHHSVSEATTWTTFAQRASLAPDVHSSEVLETATATQLRTKEETPSSLSRSQHSTSEATIQTTSSEIRTASTVSGTLLTDATITQLGTREETPVSSFRSQHSTSDFTTQTTLPERRMITSTVPRVHSREVFKTTATQRSTRKESPNSPWSSQHLKSKSTPQTIVSDRKTTASVVRSPWRPSGNPSISMVSFTSSLVSRPSTESTRVGGRTSSKSSSLPRSNYVRTGESWCTAFPLSVHFLL